MTRRNPPLPPYVHPLLAMQIEEWRRRAGVDSATPAAPVVPDRPRRRWRRPFSGRSRARPDAER